MSSNNADEIIPGLWLGNVNASKDVNFIKNNNIQVVFNCTKNLEFSPIIPEKYRLPLDDNLEEDEIRNMSLWSNDIAFKIMSNYLAGKTILVHCMAGMQRSAAAVAIFLIAYKGMRSTEAIQFIKERRPIAFRNSVNFGRSIEYFEEKYIKEVMPIVRKIMSENDSNHIKLE